MTVCEVTVTAFNDLGEISTTVGMTVTAQKIISPKAGLSLGVPAAKFQVVNAAIEAARRWESVLQKQATSRPLARDAKDFSDLYGQIVVTVSALMSSTTKIGKLQEDVFKLKPLSNDLNNQSLETLEKVITDLKSQEKAAVEGRKYLEAAAVQEKIEQKTEELSSHQHFKSQYFRSSITCLVRCLKNLQRVRALQKRSCFGCGSAS